MVLSNEKIRGLRWSPCFIRPFKLRTWRCAGQLEEMNIELCWE